MNYQKQSKLIKVVSLDLVMGITLLFFSSSAVHCESWPYIERSFGPRYYLGDEDARIAHEHFISGNYGNAQFYYQRAVEVTPQNAAAWIGLASCYDRLGRFDLAERAYKRAENIIGDNVVLDNNHGYSYLLRGRMKEARKLLMRAARYAPDDPTIANNLTMLDSGQRYFWGASPYIWGWPR